MPKWSVGSDRNLLSAWTIGEAISSVHMIGDTGSMSAVRDLMPPICSYELICHAYDRPFIEGLGQGMNKF